MGSSDINPGVCSRITEDLAKAGVILHLQNDWVVQILVLSSFALQVFLLMFGGRRKASGMLRTTLLWLAYQLADSIALFALGHLSISSKFQEHQLVAFWAPFLLVHLGGQDTITAYAFEDNRLWLRHLQTLVVQVLGATYVLYKYLPRSKTLVLVATVLMFVVGVLKYGERVWALRSATFENMSSSLDKPDTGDRLQRTNYSLPRWHAMNEEVEERVLLTAHSVLDICKGLFVGLQRGLPMNVTPESASQDSTYLGVLAEMELSLMYDVMYTKAAVIHTWYGWCIRAVSLPATAAALMLFRFSSKDGDRTNDVAITYVLLGGALVLEIISLLRALCSIWTYAFLDANAREWYRLRGVLQHLRRFVRAGDRRRWTRSVGWYDLLMSCTGDTREVTGRMARQVGLGIDSWWHKVHHSEYVKVPLVADGMMSRKILDIMRLEAADAAGPERSNTIGRKSSYRPGQYTIRGSGLVEDIGWSVGQEMGFEDSIIAWHVATNLVCSTLAKNYKRQHYDFDFGYVIRVLCNYMMYLLVVRPDMLPGPVRVSRYVQARDDLYGVLGQAEAAKAADPLQWVINMMDDSRSRGNLLPSPARVVQGNDVKGKSGYVSGVELAGQLLSAQPNHGTIMDVFFGVWVEMLRYVAVNCSQESHARQLGNGVELITILWLMDCHMENIRA